jgi:two-component system chemotaxis response regulator CheY
MSRTVLVVDDSPTVVKFVAFALKKSGFEVVTAGDGMEAVEKLSTLEGGIDLVITDLNMPNMDGYSLISTLRENPEHQATPIIILSSEGDDDDREQGMRVGASSYLVKPFRPSVLLGEVSKYVDIDKVEK